MYLYTPETPCCPETRVDGSNIEADAAVIAYVIGHNGLISVAPSRYIISENSNDGGETSVAHIFETVYLLLLSKIVIGTLGTVP